MNQHIYQIVQKLLIAFTCFIAGLIIGVGHINGFDLVVSSIFNNSSLRLIVLAVLVLLFLLGVIFTINRAKTRT